MGAVCRRLIDLYRVSAVVTFDFTFLRRLRRAQHISFRVIASAFSPFHEVTCPHSLRTRPLSDFLQPAFLIRFLQLSVFDDASTKFAFRECVGGGDDI